MKKLALIPLLLSLLGLGCQPTPPVATTPPTPTELTVYTYASLADPDYGWLAKVLPPFEQEHTIKVSMVTFPDTGTMLNQLIQEQDHPKADLVMGLDNLDMLKAEAPKLLSNFTPFDYGYVDFVYDSEKIQFSEPISLMDLTSDTYKGKIIIEQPGLSSPGTQLLVWTHAALGDDKAKQFWNAMASNGTLVAPDWSTAYYTMFLKEEAPIVLSYLTSPAYHIDQEGTERYKAIPIKEGYVRQTEGIGVVAGTDQTEVAQAFIDTLLSHAAQSSIPTTQWMWPVDTTVTLPAAYSKIITPTQNQTLLLLDTNKFLESWLTDWNSTFKIQ